jgi:hypothetical protein
MGDDRVERLHAKADECERAAASTRDPSAKQVYADLALQWRELAEQAEKRRQDLK